MIQRKAVVLPQGSCPSNVVAHKTTNVVWFGWLISKRHNSMIAKKQISVYNTYNYGTSSNRINVSVDVSA
jgi:hypothetical protein